MFARHTWTTTPTCARLLLRPVKSPTATWNSSFLSRGSLRIATSSNKRCFTSWQNHLEDTVFNKKWILHGLGLLVRAVRVPLIASGIFTIGYHQGVIESHRNPHQFQKQLLDSVTNSKHSVILSEQQVLDGINRKDNRMTHQVARVALSIIEAARKLIDHKIAEAKDQVKEKYITDLEKLTDEKTKEAFLQHKYSTDETVQHWLEAQERIDGADPFVEREQWKFVFIDDHEPNAYVTEMLPRRIFIHSGLLSYTKNVDEIAHVLGHELSHLILGHSSLKNFSEFGLNATEVLLLSIDPSAGAVTFLVVGLLATISKILKSGFSRECEQEADALGVELATMACYDAKEGSKFMYRLSTIEDRLIIKWMESHPPSIERAKDIFKQVSEIQKNPRPLLNCDNATCKAAQRARILYDVWHSSALYNKLAWEPDK